MTIDKARDFIERVAWTAIQSAAAAAIATGFDDWSLTAKVVGIAALVSALKVIAAQNVGRNADGAAIPGGIVKDTP
jgi:hypothetical protein